MKYIKPLDGLRAIAVMLVIVWHWMFPKGNMIQYGPLGVVIFFVLSGFLITKILLDGRNKTESTGQSKKQFFKVFYLRRSLRIFPVYYLLIIPFFIYSLAQYHYFEKYFYYLTYTSNFYFFKAEKWDKYFAHIWSLAVEEQFYLIWPLVILFTPKKYLLFSIILAITTGLVTQYLSGEGGFTTYLTLPCLDSLGLGALLAWVTVYKTSFLKPMYKIAGVISAGILCLLYFEDRVWFYNIVPFRMQASFIAFFVVNYIVYTSYNNKKLPFAINFVLNNRLLVGIGKISYGLYLYHVIIPYATYSLFDNIANNYLPPFLKNHYKTSLLAFNIFVLFLVAALSWNFIEKPLLRYKKRLVVNQESKTSVHNFTTA